MASARTGAETILIDRFGSLGGLQTQGNNSIFSFVDPELHGGIIHEILDRVEAGGAMRNLDHMLGLLTQRSPGEPLKVTEEEIGKY